MSMGRVPPGTLQCELCHDACDLPTLTPEQNNTQTHVCENITFRRLRLWTVTNSRNRFAQRFVNILIPTWKIDCYSLSQVKDHNYFWTIPMARHNAILKWTFWKKNRAPIKLTKRGSCVANLDTSQDQRPVVVITTRQRSCGKVMFSVLSVCHSLNREGSPMWTLPVMSLTSHRWHGTPPHPLPVLPPYPQGDRLYGEPPLNLSPSFLDMFKLGPHYTRTPPD